MDVLLDIYDVHRRERSLTPFPTYSPPDTPPESPEPRAPSRLREIAVDTAGLRELVIAMKLHPVMRPIGPEETCKICLDPFPEPTDDGRAPVVKLFCGHAYCRTCIMTWLLEVPNNSCPYCRRKLWDEPLTLIPEAFSSTGGEEEDGDDGDTVMGDDGGEEGEDHDDGDVGNSGNELDEDDGASVSVVSSDGDEGEDDVQLGSMYVGGLRRSARHRGN